MPNPKLPEAADERRSVIEAMIFASEDPVSPRTLLRVIYEEESGPDPQMKIEDAESDADEIETTAPPPPQEEVERITERELRQLVDELNDEYLETGRSFRIVEIAGGYQFATLKEHGEFVGLLSRDRARRRLSAAALETLAIIAYRQPVTKPEVESIRGVNCDQVLLSLLEKNLVTVTGRADSVGKPLLYGTTEEFLRAFGLNSLADLPKLREIEELMEEEAHLPEKPEVRVVKDLDELARESGDAESSTDESDSTDESGAEGDETGLPQDADLTVESDSSQERQDEESTVDDDEAEEPVGSEPKAADEEPGPGKVFDANGTAVNE